MPRWREIDARTYSSFEQVFDFVAFIILCVIYYLNAACRGGTNK